MPNTWGFTAFFEAKSKRRILAADVWSCLQHTIREKLPRAQSSQAEAYLWQAHEFYQAAQNPRFDSRPLLYYYAFLNVTKAFLIARGVKMPPRVFHGVGDPGANARRRLRLEGQSVRIEPRGNANDRLLPELIAALGVSPSTLNYKLLDLLAQIPGIHRTYTTIGRGQRGPAVSRARAQRSIGQLWRKGPCFALVHEVFAMRGSAGVWAVARLEANSQDVRSAAALLERIPRFRSRLARVSATSKSELWFETKAVRGNRRDAALAKVALVLREAGLWSILTPDGYRHYFGAIPDRYRLPQLASIYAVMFYLGSVTRYRPYDYDTILGGRYAWLIEEFLATQPTQFLYLTASVLAGVDVVMPMGGRSL